MYLWYVYHTAAEGIPDKYFDFHKAKLERSGRLCLSDPDCLEESEERRLNAMALDLSSL